MKEINQGLFHATAKVIAYWWRPSSKPSRPEDFFTRVTTTATTMWKQGRLMGIAGGGIHGKGSCSGGTSLHSTTLRRKLLGTNQTKIGNRPTVASNGIGRHIRHQHKNGYFSVNRKHLTVEKKIEVHGHLKDDFLPHLRAPEYPVSGKQSTSGGKALLCIGLLPLTFPAKTGVADCGSDGKEIKRSKGQEKKRGQSTMEHLLAGVNAVGET